MTDLSETVAIVTGGGRGIGRGIVLALADAGADIVIADVDLENAERTAKDVDQRGRASLVARVDVTDEASVEAGVAQALERFGHVDVLVNNAGVLQDRINDDVTGEDFDLCYQVNLKGIWNMTHALTPHLRERGSGRIVNIASIAGRRGGFGLPAYSASKAGAISLTQSLASGLARHGVTVNAVCPGLLWTPMWRKIEGMIRKSDDPGVVDERAAFEAYIKDRCPLGREQTPEDIGAAVVFLVSDGARNITGQSLNVDGGIEMN